MPLSLKLPRRNPAAPRPSLRDRLATLKGSAAKVIGKGRPRLAGGGEPSKAMSDLIIAHQLAYARCLHGMGEEGADMAALRAAEEEAFRALLHAPLTSDADRGCYAAAVIERENGFLVRGYAGTRNDPLSVAYRNLRFGDHAQEPEEMRHVGRPAEPETAADPIFSAIEKQRRLYREHDTLFAQLGEHWDSSPVRPAEQVAHAAMWEHWREVVLKTVPRTAAGCQALAAYALEFLKEQGTDLDEEGPMILDLIARSPLAKPAADAPDADDLVRLSAEQVDLSSLDVFQLSALFEAFQVAKFLWEGVMARPYSFEGGPGRSETTALGEVAGFEEERASWIMHRLEEEIAKRTPEDEKQRDEILMVRTQQEFRCNSRIHDNALLLGITRAWIV